MGLPTFTLRKICRKSGQTIVAGTLFLTVLTMSGCMTFETGVQSAIDQAVSEAVEREMSAWLAGYTDVMMYQLAYTQVFFIGGYGIDPDMFQEGQGTTWHVTSVDDDESMSYVAERALLKRLEDGSTWWYLTFEGEEMDKITYEILLSPELQAREMYFQDPESGEVRHHEFAHDDTEMDETEEGDETLEAMGYQTGYYYTEAWDDYREGTESIVVGNRTFQTDVLLFTPENMEAEMEDDYDGEAFEYRWWVSEDVPGHLVKFEYMEEGNDGGFHGELVDTRDDYTPRFVEF